MPIPNIRRVYCRPWRNGRPANSGKFPTCTGTACRARTIGVSSLPQPSTTRACVAGVGQADVLDRNAPSFRLVLHEGLKLLARPAAPEAVLANQGNEGVAGIGIGCSQRSEPVGLLRLTFSLTDAVRIIAHRLLVACSAEFTPMVHSAHRNSSRDGNRGFPCEESMKYFIWVGCYGENLAEK